MAGELGDLIGRLHDEHDENFVYRGQTKKWSPPLVPSMFRPLVTEAGLFHCEDDSRLRMTGRQFCEQEQLIQAASRLPPADIPVFMQRISVLTKLRNALGYPLSQIFAQQAGLTSEGLDVTTDIDVAAFFASHDYHKGKYVPATRGEGIIYRYNVSVSDYSFDSIRKWDFYSCPAYLSSVKIMKLFQCTDSMDSVRLSLAEYQDAIGWGPYFDLEEVRQSRPFELIQIPRTALASSRIVNQAAGLLMPDRILNRAWATEAFEPPGNKMKARGEACIEDLSSRSEADEYTFTHHDQDREVLQADPFHYFPTSDVSCEILRGWIVNLFAGPSLEIGIPTDPAGLFLWDLVVKGGFRKDPGDELLE